jgi:hypothetical protein
MIIVFLIGVCLVCSAFYLINRKKSKTNRGISNDNFLNRGLSQESIGSTATIATVNSGTGIAIRDTSFNS